MDEMSAADVVKGTVDEVTALLESVDSTDELDAVEAAEKEAHEGKGRKGVLEAIEVRRLELREAAEPLVPDTSVDTDDPEREVRMGRLTPDEAGRPDLNPEPDTVPSNDHEALSTVVAEASAEADRIHSALLYQSQEDYQTYDRVLASLRWSMHLLMHPAEQTQICTTHGKVPMTHMCSVYQNPDYATALRLINEESIDLAPLESVEA